MIHRIHITVTIDYQGKKYIYTRLITDLNMSESDLARLIYEIQKEIPVKYRYYTANQVILYITVSNNTINYYMPLEYFTHKE